MTKPPEDSNFIKNVTSLQKLLAGVAISMFVTVWVTGFDFVTNIFKPDFVKFLTYLRVSIALFGIAFTSVVGYQQIKTMLDWILKSYEVYRKISEYKKDKEK